MILKMRKPNCTRKSINGKQGGEQSRGGGGGDQSSSVSQWPGLHCWSLQYPIYPSSRLSNRVLQTLDLKGLVEGGNYFVCVLKKNEGINSRNPVFIAEQVFMQRL